MGEFKVGDRVRYTGALSLREDGGHLTPDRVGKTGVICALPATQGGNGEWDDGEYWSGYFAGNLELVEPATDELATLRTFREQALARYPDLAEPESDEDAAYRLTKAYEAQPHGTPYDLARDAIAWARANPL